jgi:hypothetical protein
VFQNPESARSSLIPVAPARSTRAISSSQKRLMPFWVFADPFLRRMCSVSRASARVARIRVVAQQPRVNARKNVPSVEGAGSQPPNSRRVRPARSTPVSSMLSAPSTIANNSATILRPAFAAPGRSPRNRTPSCASASMPSRCASVATSATPASQTTRSSSKTTCTPSGPTGPSSCTTKVTS